MRREFSAKVKKAAFLRADGKCEGCQANLGVSLKWNYDHNDADFFSKDNSLGNAVVLCEPCHKDKTKTVDMPKIAKARRLDKTRMKVKRRGTPLMGTKASGWKHKMDGTWERRR